MPLTSDFRLIRDPFAAKHPAWQAFIQSMRNRAYGEEALNDAWIWFRFGWEFSERLRDPQWRLPNVA